MNSHVLTPPENPLCRKIGAKFLSFSEIDGSLSSTNGMPFELKEHVELWLNLMLPNKWSLVYGRMITSDMNKSQTVIKRNVQLDMYLEFEDKESLMWFELVWK